MTGGILMSSLVIRHFQPLLIGTSRFFDWVLLLSF